MIGARSRYMGIVNATDDSFFYESRVKDPQSFALRVYGLIADGADIIDLGACSTRPGFQLISEDEEWRRLEPLLEIYKSSFRGTTLSLDTFRSSIVKKAYDLLDFEFIVNDITSGEYDEQMLPAVGNLGLTYIAMHHKGNLETMHNNYQYADVVKDVIDYFENFAKSAERYGIANYFIDPGFGFSKSINDNIELLKRIDELKVLGKPILIGISRKSFIYKPLGLKPEDEEVLMKTKEWQQYAIDRGVSILRVHDL